MSSLVPILYNVLKSLAFSVLAKFFDTKIYVIKFFQVFGGRSWSLTGMLKDRGHKGSWKGASNPNRTKKKSYGNIHSINDRGIHEIYESFGNETHSTGSAPTSPWSSPKLGRKSAVTVSPSLDRSNKFLPLQK